jgi:hypothetical protein
VGAVYHHARDAIYGLLLSDSDIYSIEIKVAILS